MTARRAALALGLISVLFFRSHAQTSGLQCLSQFADQILALANTAAATDKHQSIEELTQTYLEGCLQDVPVNRTTRILVPKVDSLPLLMKQVMDFQYETGQQVAVTMVDADQVNDEITFQLQNNLTQLYDGWIIDPIATPQIASANGFEDLGSYVSGDANLSWSGITYFFRETSSIYNGSVVTLPIDGKLLSLLYRRDVFQQYGLEPPRSWDEMLTVATNMTGRDFNGDGVGDYGICLAQTPGCMGGFYIVAMMASYVQYGAQSQGVFLDPTTLTPLVDNAAMKDVLTLYKAMALLSPSNTNDACPGANNAFITGRCLMTIDWGDQFKKGELLSNSTIKGKIGTARLPGSTRVLDRTSGVLEPCTPAMCPHATEYIADQAGQLLLINRAPFSAFGGWSGSVNHLTDTAHKRVAYSLFSYLAQPSRSWAAVLNVTTSIDVYRDEQMDPANVGQWTSYGYDKNDTLSYLSGLSGSLNDPNIVLDIRMPGGLAIRSVYDAASQNATAGEEVSQITPAMKTQISHILATSGYSQAQLLSDYQLAIHYSAPLPSSQTGAMLNSSQIVAAIVTPIGVLLLAVAFFVWYRHIMRSHRNLWGRVVPPGAGPDTTLVVTDIQDSTVWWESMPAAVMDRALKLHHDVIRRLLIKYNGYESATEGDSFIMAFHTPLDALLFAAEAQDTLREAPWPAELLECKAGRPVYATGTSANKKSTAQSVADAVGKSRRKNGYSEGGAAATGGLLQRIFNRTSKPNHRSTGTMNDGAEPQQQQLESYTFETLCKREWCETFQANEANTVLAFRGLRVRFGMHTGVPNKEDVKRNAATQRIAYTGDSLSLAKAVSDAACGGMIVMTEATFVGLPVERLSEDFMLAHLGDFMLKDQEQPQPVYQALDKSLRCQLALFGELRVKSQLRPGLLQAPQGSATMVFMTVVGASTLLAWDSDIAGRALARFHTIAQDIMQQYNGYTVECVAGLLLAAFSKPAEAVLWSLMVHDAMLHEDWPQELLEHELCEEVVVSQHNPRASQSGVMTEGSNDILLFCGPRLKTGMDVGEIRGDINTTSGRMAYRGKVMNRAARIGAAAATSQVYSSSTVWDGSLEDLENSHEVVSATNMGGFELKGVGKMELMCCRLHSEPAVAAPPPLAVRAPPSINGTLQDLVSPAASSAEGQDTADDEDSPLFTHRSSNFSRDGSLSLAPNALALVGAMTGPRRTLRQQGSVVIGRRSFEPRSFVVRCDDSEPQSFRTSLDIRRRSRQWPVEYRRDSLSHDGGCSNNASSAGGVYSLERLLSPRASLDGVKLEKSGMPAGGGMITVTEADETVIGSTDVSVHCGTRNRPDDPVTNVPCCLNGC